MPSESELLAERVRSLVEENRELRDRLEAIERREEQAREAKSRLMRGTFRVLLPLLDRQKVVRTFGKLAETAGEFTGSPTAWPSREKVLADTRDFLESVVRFLIRRRLFLMLFGLLATMIPVLQLVLVFQQNEIIQSQNELFEIQVYDVVARSMTEGDRNARLMTGALLANAKPAFLIDVVEEAFDPDVGAAYRATTVQAANRRLEDAAFRGHLVRSVTRSTQRRAGTVTADELFTEMRPAFRTILADAGNRVPEVMRFGRGEAEIDDELAEQVDHYLDQIGALASVYGRLARSADETETFYADLRPFLQRIAGRRDEGENRFGTAYRAALQDFLFEAAVGADLGDPAVDLGEASLTPEQAIARGIQRLREGVGEDAVAWDLLSQQVAPR